MIDKKERDIDINIKFDLTMREEHFYGLLDIYSSNRMSISGGCYSDLTKLIARYERLTNNLC